MSSDRIGKYRERSSRCRTPYSRPKGFMRRVTDSVSGILGSSWIPGFLRQEDDDQLDDEQQREETKFENSSHHQNNRGSSSSASSSRNLTLIYPEEAGGVEETASGNCVSGSIPAMGATSSSGPVPPIFSGGFPTTPAIVSSNDVGGTSSGRALFSQINSHSSGVGPSGTMGHGASTSYSLGGSSTALSQGVSSASDVQLSRRCPESNFREGPSASNTSDLHEQAGSSSYKQVLTSRSTNFNYTPSNQASKTQHGVNQSIMSDVTSCLSPSTPSARLSAAQQHSSSKRPRFSLAAYSAAATPVGDKSVLSDSSFRSSPFYPGRTIYGGAAAYRRTPTPVTPTRSATASPRIGAPNSEAGLSAAAQRILSSLNAMSTPLTDAKRIPTPSASPYTSYLDSPYTAAFHKHKPNSVVHTPRPPTSSLATPLRVGVQSSLSQYVLPTRSVTSSTTPASSSQNTVSNTFLDPLVTPSTQPSIFSVAAASSTSRSPGPSTSLSKPLSASQGSQVVASSSTSTAFGAAPSNTELDTRVPNTQYSKTSSTHSSAFRLPEGSFYESGSSGGGKMKSAKISNSGRVKSRSDADWEPVTAPSLPENVPTLPKIKFTAPILFGTSQSLAPTSATSPSAIPSVPPTSSSKSSDSDKGSQNTQLDGFQFSIPEIVHNDASESSDKQELLPMFQFSKPDPVVSSSSCSSAGVATPSFNFTAPSGSVAPKVKSTGDNVKKSSITVSSGELNKQSNALLDFLSKDKPSSNVTFEASVSSKLNTDNKNTNKDKLIAASSSSGFGDFLKSAPPTWECDTCLVRNSTDKEKCVACESAKPGSKATAGSTGEMPSTLSASSTATTTGFGSMFSKSSGDWDCDTCLLRNKSNIDECVACKSSKPGLKKNTSSSSSTTTGGSSFTFGVKQSETAKTTTAESSVSSGQGFGNMFTKTAGEWDCSECLIRNKSNVSSCVACQSKKPGSDKSRTDSSSADKPSAPAFSFGVSSDSNKKPSTISSIPSTQSLVFGEKSTTTSESNFSFGVKPSENASNVTSIFSNANQTSVTPKSTLPVFSSTSSATFSSGFGDQFKKAAGDWDCSQCLVRNKASSDACVSCQAVKPGNGKPSTEAASSLSSNSKSELPQGGFGDKFKKAPGAWDCPTCMITNGTENSKCVSCDTPKPGSVNPSKIVTGNFKFGSPKSKFSFGVPNNPSTETSLFGGTKGTQAGSVTSFGSSVSSTQSSTASSSQFSFGTNVNDSKSSTPHFSFATSTSTTTSNGGFSFDAKSSTVSSNSESKTTTSNPAPVFNFSAPSSNQSPTLKVKQDSKPSNDVVKTGSVLDFFKTTPAVSSSTTFAVSSSTSAAPAFTANGISKANDQAVTFGGNALSKVDSTQRKINFEAPSSTFNANSRDESAKTGEKRALNADVNNGPKNNGVAETTGSLFTFNKSAGNSGESAAPVFQFGNNSVSKIAPPAFGTSTPAFGASPATFNNNNNISNNKNADGANAASPVFAFGQPPEKKQTATFDFGQAASPAAASFNFSNAAPINFQFGQTGGNPGAPVFQFGNNGAGGAPPNFGGGPPGNPFSQSQAPGPAATRVMKRAMRRMKK